MRYNRAMHAPPSPAVRPSRPPVRSLPEAPLRPLLRLLLALAAIMVVVTAAGQELRIGVIVSQTGAAAADGKDQLAAVRSLERRLRSSPSADFRAIRFLIHDDRSDAATALALARELLAENRVHALVCCTLAEAASAVAPLVEQERVLTLSPVVPAAAPAAPAGQHQQPMLLVLPPDELTQLRAMTLDARQLGQRIALLTSADPAGAETAVSFRAAALEAGLHVTRVVQFPPGQRPVTPEGLLVAASQPSAVVVWLSGRDAEAAVDALRARGYTGPVYLGGEQLSVLRSAARSGDLRSVVPPARVSGNLAAGAANGTALAQYRRESGATLLQPDASYPGALMFDALELILSAFEQALTYQVSPAATLQFRQALWDGLIGAGRVDLAAGSYRFNGQKAELAIADGLVGVALRGGRLVRQQPD
jgi:branched-chain amino acid transport system substrate-binding protein